jgi:AGZA family xanthine/uracil permease-like MFS transporter
LKANENPAQYATLISLHALRRIAQLSAARIRQENGKPMGIIERRFQIRARGSTVRNEVVGGITTYATLAYILVVQPIVLSMTGMEFGAVLSATAIGSASACFIMGLVANYPIALAPAMGHNFYFALTVVLGMGISWRAALTATLIAGILFLLLTLAGLRKQVLDALPDSLMNAISVGIGLLIALVGLEWSGIIVDAQGTLVRLGNLSSPPVLLSLAGLAILSVLLVRKVPGALLIGLLSTALLGLLLGITDFKGVLSAPPSLAPTAFQLDFSLLLQPEFWIVVAVFLFLDVFDTIGTLVGIAPEAGMMKEGNIEIGNRALVADAGGTIAGSLLGTSTITCYIESAAGIQAGARTGFAAIFTGMLLLVSPFFYPLVQTIAGGVKMSETLTLYPVTAPVLIIIGVMMMKRSPGIRWESPVTAIPALLTIVIMMLSVSITDGIAFGLISYSLLSLAAPEEKAHPIIHVLAVLLVLRYVFLL